MSDDQDRDSGLGSTSNSGDYVVRIRICIPEVDAQQRQRCLQYDPDDSVWTVKQTVLSSIETYVAESFNYGLYCPPQNGRAGKFLDEDRCMKDYGLMKTVGVLELKYKTRVYKDLQPSLLRRETLAQIQSKETLMKVKSKVLKGRADRIKKLTAKGVDPNFIDPETGETPLTLAVSLPDPKPVLLALVEGGAHLDFRNTHSYTALHCAARICSLKAIQALLELGSSANYRDSKGLTPLYHCVLATDPTADVLGCMDALLYDHAATDVTDHKGCTPLHQACSSGRVQIMDKLIYYEADINCQNGNGNTPLHICAINNQEECARMLLFRGADRSILNFSDITAQGLATKAGHLRIAEFIGNYPPNEVVPHNQKPPRNPRRRAYSMVGTIRTLNRSRTGTFSATTASNISDNRRSLDVGRQTVSVQPSFHKGAANAESHFAAIFNQPQSSVTANKRPLSASQSTSTVTNSLYDDTGLYRLPTAVGKGNGGGNVNSSSVPESAIFEHDTYANLDNITFVNGGALPAPPPLPSSVTQPTEQWNNAVSVSTQNWKQQVAAVHNADKEEYENIDDVIARMQISNDVAASAGNRNSGATFLKPQNQQSLKPVPPPAAWKPKPTGSDESDLSSAASGTGSVSSTGSGTKSRPPIPSFGGSVGSEAASGGSGEATLTLAEQIQRKALQRQTRVSQVDEPTNNVVSQVGSNGWNSAQNHHRQQSADAAAHPPAPPPFRPPQTAVAAGYSSESTDNTHSATMQRTSRSSANVEIGSSDFGQLLAQKAQQREFVDPVADRRNSAAVNNTLPAFNLKKTSLDSQLSSAATYDNDALPPPPDAMVRTRPVVQPKHQKSVSADMDPSFDELPPPPSMTMQPSRPAVQPKHQKSVSADMVSSFDDIPPPPMVMQPSTANLLNGSAPKWQVGVRKSTTSTPPVSDDISSMIIPPPPATPPSNSFHSSFSAVSPPEQFSNNIGFHGHVSPPTAKPSVPQSSWSQNRSKSVPQNAEHAPLFPPNQTAGFPSVKPTQISAPHGPKSTQVPPPPRNAAVFPKSQLPPPQFPAQVAAAGAVGNRGNLDATPLVLPPPPPAEFSTQNYGTSEMSTNRRRELAAALALQHRAAGANPPPPTRISSITSSSTSSSATKRMADWTCDDVSRWLESIQMPNHAQNFTAYGVDGGRLTTMTDDDLFSHGVQEAGQRLMLLRAIKTAAAND